MKYSSIQFRQTLIGLLERNTARRGNPVRNKVTTFISVMHMDVRMPRAQERKSGAFADFFLNMSRAWPVPTMAAPSGIILLLWIFGFTSFKDRKSVV